VLILNDFKSRDFASADIEGVSSVIFVSADSNGFRRKMSTRGCARISDPANAQRDSPAGIGGKIHASASRPDRKSRGRALREDQKSGRYT
jgi:hypothetical protein